MKKIAAFVLSGFFWSSSAFALCSNGTSCPTGNSWFRELRIVNLWTGVPANLSGNDTISIGRFGSPSNGWMAACVNGVFHRIDDPNGAGTFVSAPTGPSFVCSGSGNDQLLILQNSISCGGLTIGPFDYGGQQLHIYGQAGRDFIYGGPGTDIICGGDGSDTIYGFGGVDYLDGWTGCDRLFGGSGRDYLYGYSDADWLQEFDSGSALFGEGGSDDCLEINTLPSTMDCGPGYDGVSRPGSGEVNCEYLSACSYYWHQEDYCDDV